MWTAYDRHTSMSCPLTTQVPVLKTHPQSSASRFTIFLGSRDNPAPNPFFLAQRTSLFIKINNINIHLLLTVNSLQSIHLDNVGRSKKFSYNLQPASQSKNKPKLWPWGKAEPVWSSALSTVVTHENTSLSMPRALLSGIQRQMFPPAVYQSRLLVWSASLCTSPPGGWRGELMVTKNTCTKLLLVGISDR